MDIIFL